MGKIIDTMVHGGYNLIPGFEAPPEQPTGTSRLHKIANFLSTGGYSLIMPKVEFIQPQQDTQTAQSPETPQE